MSIDARACMASRTLGLAHCRLAITDEAEPGRACQGGSSRRERSTACPSAKTPPRTTQGPSFWTSPPSQEFRQDQSRGWANEWQILAWKLAVWEVEVVKQYTGVKVQTSRS
jgi:hypothetical protein